MIQKVGHSFKEENNPQKTCAVFIYKGNVNNRKYFIEDHGNNYYTPIVLLMDEQDTFNGICDYLEKTYGFILLKENHKNFVSLGGFIDDKNFVECFSFDLSNVQQLNLKNDEITLWTPEWKLDDHICSDRVVNSGLIFCYTRYLLYFNDKEKGEESDQK